ncbi:MAG: hypothetical protein JRG94_14995 [Deltaproteobacteria bacterium]|nr:hypothetical protein [Deltaproteobacteria bacterium]MBW2726765.1 hypothetical protein [Deltaproteobacteria bacterium]
MCVASDDVAANDPRDSARQLLFVVAILASAFLIFLVQPMVGKRILPWFGGAPSVWTLCLAFYLCVSGGGALGGGAGLWRRR